MKANKLKRLLSIVIAFETMFSTLTYAENIGICTHMAHQHTGNSIPKVLDAVEEMGSDYIRDELRWGWGMQPSKTASLKMPDANWIDDAEESGVNSLVILGLGNSAFDSNAAVPTEENSEYFNAFLEYVRFVVKNCKNQVEAYEIWNEPNHGPFNYQIANKIEYNPSDYVKLVKAVSEAIKSEFNDGEKIPQIVGGAHLFGGSEDDGWVEELFKAGIGNYIDAFSIHVYTHGKNPEDEMTSCYNRVETIMDNYGYDGEIWLTETGYSTASSSNNSTEEEQAAWSLRTKILWDNYLKTNGRKGEFFWYDLRNDGTTSSNREHNFGILEFNYEKKPAFNSIKLYNELLKDRTFSELITDGYYINFKNEAKYKDEITGDYTYILYKGKYGNGSKTVPLSGNVAYVYDYQGNVLSTYTNTNQSITVSLTENPQIIHCVSYKTSIDMLKYDANKNICTVSGKTNIPNESLTITLSENGENIQSETAKIKEGEFKIQFSVERDGDYVVSVGKDELEELNSMFYDECDFSPRRNNSALGECIEYGLSASYNAATMEIILSGTLLDENQKEASGILNAVVLQDGVNLNFAKISDIVYMDDVYTENGEFEMRFSVKNTDSKKYKLYLRTDSSEKENKAFGNSENGKYVYTFDFSINENDIELKASINTSDLSNAVMVIAQYDASGRLLNVETKNLTVNAGEDCLSINPNPDAVSYKAYVWDSLSGMKPLVPMTEIK